jgi:hypothetical protein
MTDDSVGHIASVEQQFVGHGERQGSHVPAHFGQQRQATFEQSRRALFKIALVTEELAGEILRALVHGLGFFRCAA